MSGSPRPPISFSLSSHHRRRLPVHLADVAAGRRAAIVIGAGVGGRLLPGGEVAFGTSCQAKAFELNSGSTFSVKSIDETLTDALSHNSQTVLLLHAMVPLLGIRFPYSRTCYARSSILYFAAAMAGVARSFWDPTVSLRFEHPTLILLEKCHNGQPFKMILAQMMRLHLILQTFPMSRLLYFSTVSFPQYLSEALLLFKHFTPHPNLYIYNLMISALSFSQRQSIVNYKSMLAASISPDEQTFLSLLKSVKCLSIGWQIHAHVIINGLYTHVYLQNSLIKMYLEASDIENAELMFQRMPTSDIVSHNIMLSGYARKGYCGKALHFFHDMASRKIAVDQYTVVALLTCCGQLRNALLGKSIHGFIVRKMNLADRGLILTNALLDMYVKCGELNAAMGVFGEASKKDDISWNTMIAGFAKAGMLEIASKIFSEAPCKDLISWNALLAGYAQYKEFTAVMKLFKDMLASCIRPDKVTAVTLISAAAGTGVLNQGKSVHGWVVRQRETQEAFLGSALVDMYCKCGNVKSAYLVFEKALDKDVTLWTSMISGLAFHGHGAEALYMFQKMQVEGITPNGVTLLAVLSACSHAGLLDEGCRIFDAMNHSLNIEPEIEHFGCMVDLLARSGRLADAVSLTKRMPMKPSRSIWGSILSASIALQNAEFAETASRELLHVEPTEGGGYVLLSNLYAAGGQWSHSDRVRENMESKGVRKSAGSSSLAIGDALLIRT